ncbi:phage tail protein [Oceanobacillus sp. 1P07AA]|uniref:phage tail protein n=1 Tax=Oceanobacillus sp. 1P07AA TaxID=3132293 RepID=UPI0039A74170
MERANVYIFDDEDKLIHVSDEYVDDESILEEDIDNDSNNLTVVFPYTADACDYIEGENQIVVKDLRGVYRLWTIKEFEDVNGDEGKLKMAICMPSYVELNDAWVYERRPQDMPISDVLDVVLDGTRFERGRTGDYGTRSTSLYYQSVMESLKHIRSVWGGEYIDRVEFDDHGITGRFIDWERRGVNNGKRFEIDKDIQSIRRTVLHYPKTALIGRGGSVEVGEGNSRKITFEDVEWNVLNGDPVNKPKGQKYVGDPEALESYGIKTKEGKIHRIGIYDNDNITNPEELLQVTWENVQNNSKPQVKYEMSVRTFYGIADYEHEQVYLGDTGYIIDEEMRPALTVQSRIIKVSYSIGNPSVGDITVGNFLRIKGDESKLDWVISKVTENSGSWDSGGIIDDDSFPNVKPPAPDNLQATGLFSSIMLKWDYDPSVYIAEYRVYGSTNANFVPSDSDNFLYATKSGGYAHDAEVNEQWYFVVCTVNTHGQRSDFSQMVMAQTKKIDGNTEVSEQTITKELLAQQAMIDEVHLNNAIITDAHINGRLTANVLMIGDGALYDDGYDPSDKADKTYVDNAINNLDFEGADNLLSDTKFERFAIDGNEDQWRFAIFGTATDVQGYQQRGGAIGIYVDVDGSVRLYSPPFIQELNLNEDIVVSYEARIVSDTLRPYVMGALVDNLDPAQYSLTNFLTDELPIDDDWTRYIYKIPAGTFQGSSGNGFLAFYTSWDTDGRRDIHIKKPMVIQSSGAQKYRPSPEDQIEEYTQKKYNLLQNGSFNIGKQGWNFSNQYANARTTILAPESDKPNSHIVHINQQIYNGLYSIQNNRYVLSQAGNFFTLTLDVKFDEIVDPTTQDFRIIRILTSPNTEDNLMKADGIRFSNPAPSTWSNVIMFSDVMDQYPNLQAGEWAKLDFEILITQRDIEDWWGVQFLTTGWIDDDQTIRTTDYYIREVMLVNGGIPKQFAEDPTSLWAYRNSIYMDGGSLYANSVTANEIAAGTITANSGIIANAAITNAMIQEISAEKLMAGSVIAEDVTIKGRLEGVSGTFSESLNAYDEGMFSHDGGFVRAITSASNLTSRHISSARFPTPYERDRPEQTFVKGGYSLAGDSLLFVEYTSKDMIDAGQDERFDSVGNVLDALISQDYFRSSLEINGGGLTFTRGATNPNNETATTEEIFNLNYTTYSQTPSVSFEFFDDMNTYMRWSYQRDLRMSARHERHILDGSFMIDSDGDIELNSDLIQMTDMMKLRKVESNDSTNFHGWWITEKLDLAKRFVVQFYDEYYDDFNGSGYYTYFGGRYSTFFGIESSRIHLVAGHEHLTQSATFHLHDDESLWQIDGFKKMGIAMEQMGYIIMGQDIDNINSTSNYHLKFDFTGPNSNIAIDSNAPVVFNEVLASHKNIESGGTIFGSSGNFGDIYSNGTITTGRGNYQVKIHDDMIEGGNSRLYINGSSNTSGFAGLRLRGDTDQTLMYFNGDSTGGRIYSDTIFDRTYSNSPNMYITGSGTLGRSTSASKYKLNIEEAETTINERILDLVPKKWNDKESTEAYARYLTKKENGECGDEFLKENDIPVLKKHYGLIAEDLVDVGLDMFVQYGEPDENGHAEVEGIEYDRAWVLLIPLVKEQKSKIKELEEKIDQILAMIE